MAIGPPDEAAWPPPRLFRLLIQRPRPRLPLPPLSALPGVQLFVRAMRSTEEHELSEAGPAESLPDRIVVASTWTAHGPAFAHPAELGLLTMHDWHRLVVEVDRARAVCSPTYTDRFDGRAWMRALEKGADDESNVFEALLLGNATDWSGGGEQPDRYYGVPLADLTDGQLMAYRAARKMVEKLRK